ncbi:hypothetical protein [Lysobacter enzymogenes]|uniref:Lipoprotein n=1 Tax=Lysobacter enzymogenes TaxID=69 RepID=A0A3N2RJZ0_LYSEN|nr:hypothetical protein [Lysobacter enzymogenes]ROU07709.1 hypothetical protein D9T17_07995 [Lysobacter enzymogenes]
MRRIAPTSPRSRRRRIASACACAALALGLGGCGAVRTIAGINTVHLEQARVDSMQIDLASGAATVCPRERVQMHVVVGAQLPSQAAPLLYESWRGGNGTRRNGMLDFRNFAFNSEQGRFDELGWFAPDPDVLATVDSGFAIGANLIHPSAQFARTAHYPPSYDCIAAVGAPGGGGAQGRDGSYGDSGSDGRDGGHGGLGGLGGYGRNGGDGEPGGGGYDGPHLRAYATYVATGRYPKLLAVRVEGDLEDLVLAPAGRAFTVIAGGGRGGEGGEIELVYDRRFPELAELLRFDVSGGIGGDGGSAGSGGSGGDGGHGGLGKGRDGRSGDYGSSGPVGPAGRPGLARMWAGDVSAQFRGLPGVKPL